MNYEIKNLEKSAIEVKMSLTKEEVSPIIGKIVEEFAKEAEIPGFRKGHAPKDAILAQFKEKIEEEAVAKILNEKFPEIIEKEKINPVSYANVIEKNISEKDSNITFKIDVFPQFDLANYKKLGIEKEVIEIKDELVDEEIKHLVESAKKLEEVQDENYTAQMGDTVNLAFEGFVDGEAFAGGKSDAFDLKLGSHSFIDNFEDQLVGYKKGQEGEVNVTFPAEYHVKELASKPAVFKVKINTIKQEKESVLNDEFAKEHGSENVEALKVAKKEELQKLEEERATNEYVGKLLEKITNDSNITLPESMVMHEVENRLREFEYQLSMQGMKFEDYIKFTGGNIETLIEQIRPMCEHKVKVDLVLEKIVEAENIVASEEELKEQESNIAKMYGMTVEQLEEELKKNKNLDNFKLSMKHDVAMKKAMDFIKDNQ